MKAISLWQPWASLIALGLKQYETRSWYTSHRGPIAIHAAKRWTSAEQLFTVQFAEQFKYNFTYPQMKQLVNPPLGAVLCICNLTDCISTNIINTSSGPEISIMEYRAGNFAPDRFAWKLELVEVFDTPIPAVDKQGLWSWERAS